MRPFNKYKLLFIILILFNISWVNDSYSKSQEDLRPDNFIDAAPNTSSHKTIKKIDTTGGLHLSSPQPGRMKYMRGADVANDCAFFGMTYTDPELCKNLVQAQASSFAYTPSEVNQSVEDVKDKLGLTAFGSENCRDYYGSKYVVFRRHPATTPPMSEDEKKTLDACLFYCRKSPDNEVSRKICDVRDCIYILKNNSGSDESQKFCFHILDGWMLKTRNENIKEAIKEGLFRDKNTNFKGVPAAYCLTNFQTYLEDNDAEYERACCSKDYTNFVLNYHGVNDYDFIEPICPIISD